MMRARSTLRAAGVTTVALAVVATGCAADQEGVAAGDVYVGHVHGIGVDPADGALYVGAHGGLFRLADGELSPVSGWTSDTMGFTVVGAGTFLASGHPAPDQDGPGLLGLNRSTDAGESWSEVSLVGEADFHSLDAVDGAIWGYDSVSGRLLTSADGKDWASVTEGAILDVAVQPGRPDEALATTGEGRLVRVSSDGSTAPEPLESPPLVLVDATESGELVGLGPDGAVHVQANGGRWEPAGEVPGGLQALTATDDAWYAATDTGIYVSSDRGEKWETAVRFS
ncbi:F510_1955 family glycosylhydrolase [Nocardioides donggukensis]|uniref:Exo-alpha-sialidase n=1 Tax=Nocardioides donggukensis TaxID=2774019 RepID=A0A927KA18_9ACTN|nr:hypothetical protein [Nocardioides donggukensis]MBD8870400.1 hypothetical protein [Nocardioides donggukensis]